MRLALSKVLKKIPLSSYMKRYLTLIMLILLFISLECISTSHTLSVYFYYSPNCPWCKYVKPYMELLKSKASDVRFEFCNVEDFENCSIDAKRLAEDIKLKYIPTIIIKNSDTIILTGAYEVLKIGKILRGYGYDVSVNFSINGLDYSVKDCISCHVKMNLKPPVYNCSYCCHKG